VVLSIKQFQSCNPGDCQSVHVTPEKAVVRGTVVRSTMPCATNFKVGLEKTVRYAAEAAGAGHKFLFKRDYPVLHNTENETRFAGGVAREVAGAELVQTSTQPIMGAEDFAFISAAFPAPTCFWARPGKAKPRPDSCTTPTMISTTTSYRPACAIGHAAERYLERNGLPA
jgi:hippurate hydrolase